MLQLKIFFKKRYEKNEILGSASEGNYTFLWGGLFSFRRNHQLSPAQQQQPPEIVKKRFLQNRRFKTPHS